MWSNGRNGEFTDPMSQEILVRSTTITKLKVHGITEDCPLFFVMIKIMSEFDKLEERMFGAPIVTLPHAAHISELALDLVNLMRGRFTTILINMECLFLIINPIWPL